MKNVNKKIKRRRQNARLRKILQPKNPITLLNEMKPGVKYTFTEPSNALTQTLFFVNVKVDGKNHLGQGLSKSLAKMNASENALKVLLLEKMTLNNGNGNTEGDIIMAEDGDEKQTTAEDEVPWGSLASFALFKLLTEWQGQGTAPMKQLPNNPTHRHPVMLLKQLRPGVKFVEKAREGIPPNVTFTLKVNVDGVSYEGVAKNKKDAKKETAKAALGGLFGLIYQ